MKSRYASQNRYFSLSKPPRRQNYDENAREIRKEGLTAQNLRFPSPIFDYSALQPPKPQRNEDFEQSVPGYGPQLLALRWPPHATIAILYACGPILNRDVPRATRAGCGAHFVRCLAPWRAQRAYGTRPLHQSSGWLSAGCACYHPTRIW